MQKITSFTIDHDLIEPGIYISRIDSDIITFDLRTRKPNSGNYMDNVTMHTVEHMFATFIRNSEIGSKIIYFGPMGCQTGFYLLVRNFSPSLTVKFVIETLEKIVNYEGPVFGATRKECGNYQNLDLESAKRECAAYLEVLKNSNNNLKYDNY